MGDFFNNLGGKIKGVVSKNKRRFTKEGFDLDLTYIFPNIIAMGYPAESVEGIYRNNIDDVVKFLNSKHADVYKIFNLCAEKTYDEEKFHNCVNRDFTFKDHNPPPFSLIGKFCKELDKWLLESSSNIGVIHCKAGKGRTGVMIASYLIHSERCPNADQALSFYATTRTTNEMGVTIPSQRRYVRYYDHMKKTNGTYAVKKFHIKQIRFHGIPTYQNGTCSPFFSVILNDEGEEKQLYAPHNLEDNYKVDCSFNFTPKKNIEIYKDVKLEFYNKRRGRQKAQRMFYIWFNTSFINGSNTDDPVNGSVKLVNLTCGCKTKDAASYSKTSNTESCLVHANNECCDCLSEKDYDHLLTFTKDQLDKANKDKNHKIFPSDFKVSIFLSDKDSRGTNEASSMLTFSESNNSENRHSQQMNPVEFENDDDVLNSVVNYD